MNLTQRQLRMFVITAQQGNVSRASEVLCISQPALSRGLKEFESQLGVTLLLRTTRKMTLTADGQRFLPMAQRLLRDLEQVACDLQDQATGMRGTVNVAVGAAFACTSLAETVRAFQQNYPAVRIRLLECNSAGMTRMVESTGADLGIGSPVGDIAVLRCQHLLSAPLGLLASPDHHDLDDFSRTGQVTNLPLLREADDTSIMHLLRTHGSDILGQMELGVEVSGLSVQLAFARAGVGVAVVSALAASHQDAKDLRFVPIAPVIERKVFMIQRRDGEPSAATRAFALAVRQGLPMAQFRPEVRVFSG